MHVIAKNVPLKSGTFFARFNCLNLADVEGVWAFWAVADLKRDLVSFLELIERNVLELVGMEEKILCLAIAFDETEAFLVLLDDYSFLHTVEIDYVSKISNQ